MSKKKTINKICGHSPCLKGGVFNFVSKFFIKKFRQNMAGFTLLETIFAITIITISLLGVYTLITSSGRSIAVAQEKLVASSLITEGLEIVYNMRNNNWINSRAFAAGLSDGDWEADYSSASLVPSSSRFILFDQTSHLYTYASSSATIPTIYKRKITLTNISSTELKAVVLVTWSDRGTNYQASSELHLYDWK